MEKDGWTYKIDMGGEWFEKQIGYLRVSVTDKLRVHTLDQYDGYMATVHCESFNEARITGQLIVEDASNE